MRTLPEVFTHECVAWSARFGEHQLGSLSGKDVVDTGPNRLHIAMFNRRDTTNPEGGGSERYGEVVASALAEAGHWVVVYTADHGGAPRDEVRGGVTYRRRGGKLSVIPRAWWDLLTRRIGPVDVVVDVQNGVPFLSRLATRKPVVALVHHVHREMWPVVYGRSAARLGWWVESVVGPSLYRRSQYVAVSRATRDELVTLGVSPQRIAVVHNGVDPALTVDETRDPRPTICVLGRLVPHKRVEHVVRAAAQLRPDFPDLRVRVVGDGWWADHLRAETRRGGVDDLVTFTGFVDEQSKHVELARAWVHAIPSLKEGWGLSIMEAATHSLPSVGYREAVGVAESIVHDETGLVVDGDESQFVSALRRLLSDQVLRDRLGEAGRRRAATYSWATTARSFTAVLAGVVTGQPPVGFDDMAPDATHSVSGVEPNDVATVLLSGMPLTGGSDVSPRGLSVQRLP